MATLRSDRRLFLTADKSRVVEDGDPGAAFLLAGRAGLIAPDDVDRYKLAMKNRKIVYPGWGEPEEPEPVEESVVVEGAGEGAEEPDGEDEPEEWEMGVSPARYITMNEGSENPEVQERVALARRIMERGEG